ncbi:MAG TPA: dTMP kinase [Myxococcaceae bacterium]|nr:dTMP kinase [Myxococcaceae bacterium]
MSRTRRRAPGLFVVFEGIDGAGTTTQVRAVAEALRNEGRRVHATFEPSGGPVGTLLRQALTHRLRHPDGSPLAPETLALLFAADRTDHLRADVMPALERGEVVLCDRYLLSSLAYQGLDLPEAWIESINGRALVPDVTFFVEVGAATAGERRRGRGGAAEMFDADDVQSRIARRYRQVVSRRKGSERIVSLEGRLPPQTVTAQALEALRPMLGKG